MRNGKRASRPRPGQPAAFVGPARFHLKIKFSAVSRKATIVEEALALGLSTSDYIERCLFSRSGEERMSDAARGARRSAR